MFCKNKEKGTNLVEVLVVISIFSFFLIAVMFTFVSFLQQQRRVLIRQELLSQTTYAIEKINRALRFSEDGYEGGGSSVSFINQMQNSESQRFYLEDGQIFHEREGRSSPLTSEKFEVENLDFSISNDPQPKIGISFEIKSEIRGDEERVKIRTTVSQRNLKDSND